MLLQGGFAFVRRILECCLDRTGEGSYFLTFGAAFIAAVVNLLLGLILAWVLVRYSFPGKKIVDSLVDLPLALPTAVAGLVYGSLYVEKGYWDGTGAARNSWCVFPFRYRPCAGFCRAALCRSNRAAYSRRFRRGGRKLAPPSVERDGKHSATLFCPLFIRR